MTRVDAMGLSVGAGVMDFAPLGVEGAWLVTLEPRPDERGAFVRTFDRAVFAARGLVAAIEQASASLTHRRGTLRGLHYQAGPFEETKIVRVTRGVVHDVIVDLRRHAPTYLRAVACELAAERPQLLYVPRGCAHGFLTLTDEVEVAYQMDQPYEPGAARGVRFDDPAFAIEWPFAPLLVHDRDRAYPDWVV